MSQLQTFIDPTSTSELLNNLNLAIDETKLVRAIDSMQNDIYKIESISGPSKRTHFLRKEIFILQEKLAQLRQRVRHG